MAEILHHLGCQPNFEIMGVAGGSIKDAIMHDMAGGAGFQPSTVLHLSHVFFFLIKLQNKESQGFISKV